MVVLVMNGKFESVQVNYPVAGHTKFGPDGMFGWLGPLLRNFDLYEIEDIVDSAKGGPARYGVEKLNPTLLMDYAAYIHEHVLKAVNGINARHGILVTKTRTGCKLQVRDYSSDQWTTHKEFNSTLATFKAERLEQVELSAAKVKDLMKQEVYSPSGKLSYAHFESVNRPLANPNPPPVNANPPPANANPPPANANPPNNTNDANPDAMQVEIPILSQGGEVIEKCYGIAYYMPTPTGSVPIYVVKMNGKIVYSQRSQ